MLPLALGLGTPEIAIIVLVIVILFGVKKLPEMGKSLAEGIHEFRKATSKIHEDVAPDSTETKTG